jgi:N6-adenosine-specific RNA methylase IME4
MVAVQPMLFSGAQLRADWPFGALAPGRYGLIMADPPWRFELYSDKGKGKSAQAHYACMSPEAIKALPVGELAARDCVLWLWATAPLLPLGLEVMAAWGARYVTLGWWNKRTASGRLRWGTGYRLRSCGELFLIGLYGAPTTARDVPNVVDGIARGHSEKPEAAFAAARKMVGADVSAVELFSRRSRAGWDAWGDEAGKLNEQPEMTA